MSITETTARRRNLLISIIRGISRGDFELSREYSLLEIETVFHFRKRDIAYNLEYFLNKTVGNSFLSQESLRISKKYSRSTMR